MGHIGGSRGIGRRTHTGFVGVQTALDALHHSAAGKATEDGLEVKGAGEDLAEHGGDQLDVDADHGDRHQNIDDTHHGNQNTGNVGQTLGTAQHTGGKQNGQNRTDDDGGAAAVEAEAGEGGLQVVGGQHIVADGIGADQHNGKNHAQPTLLETAFDVVGGTAVAGAVLIALFVDLCQRGLNEGGSAAQNGGDPHPEHGAVAAHADSGGHAHDVAGADTGGGGDHQCAEGGDTALFSGLLGDNADGFAEQTELDQTGADGEVQSCGQQENRHPRIIQESADGIDHIVNGCKNRIHSFLSFRIKITQTV